MAGIIALKMSEARYSRLMRYAPYSGTLPGWQRARIAIVGLGGLGGGLAIHLARMGAGSTGDGMLRLIDRDFVEPQNLGHQLLFNAAQAEAALPKAEAARESLVAINPDLKLEARAEELTRRNILDLLQDCELIFDGLDNYYGRLLLNDYARSAGIPYFHAGVVRGELSAKAVLPGRGSCLRCFLEAPPLAGETATCASEGVFPPLLQMANALQIDLANRWLGGSSAEGDTDWFSLDAASWKLRRISAPQSPDCPACQGRYEFLEDSRYDKLQLACSEGRFELQGAGPLDLARIEELLRSSGEFVLRRNRYLLSAERRGRSFAIFPGGRVVLSGAAAAEELSSFASEYLGA